jgi:hypothetical protein
VATDPFTLELARAGVGKYRDADDGCRTVVGGTNPVNIQGSPKPVRAVENMSHPETTALISVAW